MITSNNFTPSAFFKNAKKNVLGLSLLVGLTGAYAQNTFPATGNVGVGTLSPVYPLHLSNGPSPGINLQIEGTNTAWTGMYINNNTTTGTSYYAMQSNNGSNIAWHYLNSAGTLGFVNGSERLTITKTGFIGISNTAPSFALDVTGRVRFGSGGGTAGAWYRNAANTADPAFVGLENDTHLGIWGSGSGWSFRVNTVNGNVGIGTLATSTVYKLSVNGSIRAKELVVETGWADYVFDKNYKLRSLKEVESYIQANNHLPDVPSAADVAANGVKVGEMESTLLQKIEELTLYSIQQNKEIEALKAKLELLLEAK